MSILSGLERGLELPINKHDPYKVYSSGPEYSGMHYVPFSLMGAYYPLPGYKSGDCVNYGGMIYRPQGGLMVHKAWDGKHTWGGNSGYTCHYANLWGYPDNPVFFCS